MMSIWSVPEITIGFVVMCLPTLPRLLKHLKHKALVSSISKSLKTGFWGRKSGPGSDGSGAAPNGDGYGGKKLRGNVIVTDIEFHQLVEKRGSDGKVNQDSGVHVGRVEVKAFNGDNVV
jgi:hypothetical protein